MVASSILVLRLRALHLRDTRHRRRPREVATTSAFDFYLCSHGSLKGTSRPTHYSVLTNELGLSADEIQRLTFDLCHCYARCTRTVSNPVPCYYAHLAANHAHFYMRPPAATARERGEDEPDAEAEPEDPEKRLEAAAERDAARRAALAAQFQAAAAAAAVEAGGAPPPKPAGAPLSGGYVDFLSLREGMRKLLYFA